MVFITIFLSIRLLVQRLKLRNECCLKKINGNITYETFIELSDVVYNTFKIGFNDKSRLKLTSYNYPVVKIKIDQKCTYRNCYIPCAVL